MTAAQSRRAFLTKVGGGTVPSAAAIALLGEPDALAGSKTTPANPGGDVAILNVALGLEHEAIAAYQIGAESGLLMKPALDVAVLFQSQHKAHRDALASTIEKLGGKPVSPLTMSDYTSSANCLDAKRVPSLDSTIRRL